MDHVKVCSKSWCSLFSPCSKVVPTESQILWKDLEFAHVVSWNTYNQALYSPPASVKDIPCSMADCILASADTWGCIKGIALSTRSLGMHTTPSTSATIQSPGLTTISWCLDCSLTGTFTPTTFVSSYGGAVETPRAKTCSQRIRESLQLTGNSR